MKICSRCGEEHANAGFYKNKASKDGLTAACRLCIRGDYSWGSPAWAQIAVSNARHRAGRQGVPFDAVAVLTVLLEAKPVCPVLGIALVAGGEGHQGPVANSATVDRFNPAAGYVAGNLTVISRRANSIKSDASLEEVEAVAKWMRSR